MPNRQTDLLNGLTKDEEGQVIALGSPVALRAGDSLFELGEEADRVYQLVRGRIALTLPMRIRGEQEDVLVEERLAGETLGWSGLIPPHRFTLKATAAADSELLAFSRSSLQSYFASHPAVAYCVTRNVAAVIGHRLGVFQAMWLREMQRVVEIRYS